MQPEPLCICDSKPPLHDQVHCPALLAGLESELASRGIHWNETTERFEREQTDA